MFFVTPVTTVFFEIFGIVKAVPRVGADPFVIVKVQLATLAEAALPAFVTLGTVNAVPKVGAEPTFVTFGIDLVDTLIFGIVNAVPKVGADPTLVTFGTVNAVPTVTESPVVTVTESPVDTVPCTALESLIL